MWTEHARQTRWGHDPEAVDESRTPPGATYVKQVIWTPCNQCDLQVHATVTRCLSEGVTCPECGSRLVPPGDVAQIRALVQQIARDEERLRARWEDEEIPCSD